MPTRKPRSPAAPDKSLRYAAELAYTMGHGEMTLQRLTEHPLLADIPIARLRAWAEQDDWDSKRRHHFGALRDSLRRKMDQEMMQERSRQIGDLESMLEQGMMMLEDERLVPKLGWEGMSQAVLRIGESLDKQRARVMRDVLRDVSPGPQASAPAPSLGGHLSPDEARAAARAIVMARQQRLRLQPPGQVADGRE